MSIKKNKIKSPLSNKPTKTNPTSTWKVYILKCGDGSFYTGITTDIVRRVEEHQSGKGAKYTRGKAPFEIVYTRNFKTRSAASKLEAHIKRLSREEKLALISKK